MKMGTKVLGCWANKKMLQTQKAEWEFLYFLSFGSCSYWWTACHYKLMGTPKAAFSRKSGCLTLPFLLCKWPLAAGHAFWKPGLGLGLLCLGARTVGEGDAGSWEWRDSAAYCECAFSQKTEARSSFRWFLCLSCLMVHPLAKQVNHICL